MGVENQRANRVFFSAKETTAGTIQATNFFEGHGEDFALPEPEFILEPDTGKMGSGELGKKQTLEGVSTTWSYKTKVFSEYAYFAAYAMGKQYTPIAATAAYQHEIAPKPVNSLLLPTFTIEYGKDGSNVTIKGNVVNEVAITYTSGGAGFADATITGYGTMYTNAAGAGFTAVTAGTVSAGVNSFDSEPLLKLPSIQAWLGTTADAVPTASALDYDGENLAGTPTDITTILKGFTVTINNGMTATDQITAGGYGVRNKYYRGVRNITAEIVIDKDDTIINTNTLILNNTKQALEVQFNGPIQSGTEIYSMDWLFNVVQLDSGKQDTGTPINKVIPLKVFEDSDAESLRIFVQSGIATAYNA